MAKYTQIFTNTEDVDREILLRIPDDTNLFKACCLSIYTTKLYNNYFWKQRFIRKYNVDLDKVGQNSNQGAEGAELHSRITLPINYRELYRELMNKSKYVILLYGASNGYLGLAKEMVRRGTNIHSEDDWALVLAARNGHLEVVKYLIEKGADIHARDDRALTWAAENGHLEVVKYLIENGADINSEDDFALRAAAKYGYLEVVKYLIENGANIHARNDWAMRYAAREGHLEVVKYLLQQGANWKKIGFPSEQVQMLIEKYGKDW